MLRLLDRYLVARFAKAFLGALVLFAVGIAALDYLGRSEQFDALSRLEGTFAEGYSKPWVILRFYAAYLPFLLKEVLPFISVAACLFTLTEMLHSNEVFPVVAAGVSARRLCLPLFLCGAVLSCGYMLFQELVVPTLSREQILMKRFFAGGRQPGVLNPIHLRDGSGTVTRAGYYRFQERALEDVVVQRPWRSGGFDLWTAPRLLPAGRSWVAPEGGRVQPAGVDSPPRTLAPGAPVDLGITPDEVDTLVTKHGTGELGYGQLRRLVERFPERLHLRVAFHKQIARPFGSVVLLLVGVPILLASGRSYFLGASVAFAVSVTYYGLDLFFTSLGNRGDLPAPFAAYFPLGLLLSLGVARLATVPT